MQKGTKKDCCKKLKIGRAMGGLGREEMERHPLWGLGGHFLFFFYLRGM